jgi:hypothetical protein
MALVGCYTIRFINIIQIFLVIYLSYTDNQVSKALDCQTAMAHNMLYHIMVSLQTKATESLSNFIRIFRSFVFEFQP